MAQDRLSLFIEGFTAVVPVVLQQELGLSEQYATAGYGLVEGGGGSLAIFKRASIPADEVDQSRLALRRRQAAENPVTPLQFDLTENATLRRWDQREWKL